MKYSVKWVEENLGISRKALRNYEEKGVMPKGGSRNPDNNYREYDEEDIARIWSIKLLQGIGFSLKEIHSFIENPKFDFHSAIAKKVDELEKKRDEVETYIEFAKSIRLTGRVPTVSKIGSIKYEDFIQYARENWNFYADEKTALYVKVVDTVVNKTPDEWELEDFQKIERLLETFDEKTLEVAYKLESYYQLIFELRHMGHTNEMVQTVVRLLYEYTVEQYKGTELEGKVSPQFFARDTVSAFIDSDIALVQERNYGKEGCEFIANAIAFFGGYEDVSEL